jgi:hypothetical protein
VLHFDHKVSCLCLPPEAASSCPPSSGPGQLVAGNDGRRSPAKATNMANSSRYWEVHINISNSRSKHL